MFRTFDNNVGLREKLSGRGKSSSPDVLGTYLPNTGTDQEVQGPPPPQKRKKSKV